MQPETGELDTGELEEGHHRDKIVMMANQIATFFASQQEAVRAEGVATHINKFWDPRMRAKLFDKIDAGGTAFNPLVIEAAAMIRRPHADPDSGAGTGAAAEAGAPEGKGTAAGEAKSETNFPEIPSG